jgi:hypothetical protein
MADERIKDIARTVTDPKSAEYVETDHADDGTGKLDLGAWLAARRNALAPRGGLAFDGTASTRVYSTLTNQAIGTDAFSLVATFKVPSSAPSADVDVCALAASATTSSNVSSGNVAITSGGALLLGVTTSGAVYAYHTLSGFVSAYAGKVVTAVFTRSGTTVALYINGVAQTLSAVSSSGGATMGDSITSTYFLLGFKSASGVYVGAIYSASLYNLALDQASITEIYELGGAVPQRYKFGSQLNDMSGNDSTFAGAGNWLGVGSTVATVTGGQLVATGITNSGSNFLSSPTWVQSASGSKRVNRRYRLTFDVVAISLGGAATAVSIFSPVVSNGTPVGAVSTAGAKTIDFDYVSGGSDASPMVSFYRDAASGTCDITIDNVVLRTIGAVCHYDADLAGIGYQLHDQSTNKLHALLTTTGVSWTKAAPMGYVKALSDGTASAQALGGGTILPANIQIVRIRARSLTGTPNAIFGTSSGGSQIVASVALSTAWKDLTIALTGGINTAANSLWMTASAANVVEVQLAYEQLPA